MRDVARSGLDSCLFQRQVIETTLEPHPELTTHVECIIYNIASLSHRLALLATPPFAWPTAQALWVMFKPPC